MRKTAMVLLSIIISASLFASNIPNGFKEVKKEGGITEYQLEKNGLNRFITRRSLGTSSYLYGYIPCWLT